MDDIEKLFPSPVPDGEAAVAENPAFVSACMSIVSDRAAALGIPAIAIDRPGYGSSTALPPAESTVLNNAAILDEMIGEIWTQYGAGARGVVLIGHSIGGAVT